MQPDEANRYNVLKRSWYYDGAVALLGPARERFLDQYKFDVFPATDDRPFFFHFFKWRTLPELLALKERGGMPLLEWGYPVLIATLIQAAAAGTLLILLPLLFTRPLLAIGLLALLYIALLPHAFAHLMPQPDAVRIALSEGLIAPLPFAMGMPFPRGVAELAKRATTLLPWAWGVVAAILATVLALHVGFNAVVALAVIMYGWQPLRGGGCWAVVDRVGTT